MKIGLVTPAWPGGRHANGITTTVVFLVEGLESLGHEVTLISLAPDDGTDPRCISLPPQRRMTLRERAMAALDLGEVDHAIIAEGIATAALTAMRTRGIEVLVMEETHGWAGLVQRMLPIPVIVTLHGPWYIQTALQNEAVSKESRRREQREALAFRNCAGVTSPSRHVLEKTREQVPDMTALQSVIHNPIRLKDPVSYDRLDARQSRSILFVGRHDHRKGADVLLQAFTDLIGQGGDAYLTFIGPDNGVVQADGTSIGLPQALARLGADVQARITYLGAQSKEEIDAQRRRHFLTVIASRYETFGYVVLEAMAAGSATISTAAGGPTEIIRDGQTGLLVPVDDAEALTHAFRILLDDPELAASLGRAARQDVAERFAPEKIADQLARFAQQVVAQART